ncbi:outer cell wall protein [Geosmithia morbida]|uniref:Outer cell wall protein n=1 Tax=Geosmithia morbida TaxID=1094350 RepID=A0A9P4YUR5_9HYPO|nr:outer cell wall protein [Geosmithia morbida]KAF4122066.1 outer cell wall protein [Geosmithia morbida]
MVKSAVLLAHLAAGVAAVPQGAPRVCRDSFDGGFQIAVNQPSSKRSAAQTCSPGSLVLTLNNGILRDQQQRTGYIASNFQFQFDNPPQHNALSTRGFSICPGGLLALDGDTRWFQCLSGTFYNLYDRHWAGQCQAISIRVVPCPGNVGPRDVAPVQQISDGQVQAPASRIPNPPVQAPVIAQIPDGQVQVPVASRIPNPPVQAPVITQISDGQVQVPVASRIPYHPVQAPAPSGPAVSQIPDGQIQAPVPGLPHPPQPSTCSQEALTCECLVESTSPPPPLPAATSTTCVPSATRVAAEYVRAGSYRPFGKPQPKPAPKPPKPPTWKGKGGRKKGGKKKDDKKDGKKSGSGKNIPVLTISLAFCMLIVGYYL